MSVKLRTPLVAALAAALLAPASAPADGPRRPAARQAQECADADLVPAAGNLARVRAAVVCLHNRVRAGEGLRTLKENARLRRAATGHSRAMVANGFFEHTSPTGSTMVDRILRSRYVRRGHGWVLGENLAWGTDSLATPRSALDAWLSSPGHRANLLKPQYRELGVGVVLGVPVAGTSGGATYTVDFGVRR